MIIIPRDSKKLRLPKGIVTALITPVKNERVYVETLERLVDFHLRNDISGFFILGTYGEGLSLHPNLRKIFAEKVVEYVGSKVPVINCVSSTSIDISLELTKHSVDIGIEHIALLPPFYYRGGLQELLRYYKAFERFELDVIIYNYPMRTGIDVTPTIFKAISANVNNLVGIKDSTASIERLLELTEELSHEYYVAIAGDIMILEAFLYNADSHICGICNAIPELSRLLLSSLAKKDISRAIRCKRHIWRLRKLAKDLNVEGVSLTKALLKLRGLDVGDPLPPNRNLDEKELLKVKEALDLIMNDIASDIQIDH